ncbi:MAG: aspartate aminotransferase family protein [Rhodospirillaceae bacterium]|nr:aspartate aminotransferase family protein [Rhodospirillaceae bacterium]MBT7956301.1 aspartate aminotransferase family protein [Rhodospirillaceae bacterium]
MPTYAPADIAFEHGEGVYLYSTDGKKYVDFGSGIAVSALGHSHPHLVAAIQEQAGKVMHYSNLYRIPGQETLAQRLVDNSFASSVFCTNSGAEAVECGLKIVRRYHDVNGNPDKYRVITCTGSFHGRTLATLSAAKNEKHMDGFTPMLDGFDQVPFGNLNELRAAVTEETAAILVEPIQGEGGITYAEPEYFKRLRDTADEFGLLLFLDEVQTGIGRTGKLFAHEWADIQPDVVAAAKGLGGGFPVGACLANEKATAAMAPGTHGSTFGGNPMASAAANAVLDIVLGDGFLENVQKTGAYLRTKLEELSAKHAFLGDVRGQGLLTGIVCDDSVVNLDLVKAAENIGLLTVPAGANVVRVLPPLIVTEAEIDEGMAILDQACGEMGG